MKLLVVEDEPKTGEYLQQGLTEAGFVVDLARNCHFQKTTAPVHWASRRVCIGLLNVTCQESYARNAARGRECSEVTCTARRSWNRRKFRRSTGKLLDALGHEAERIVHVFQHLGFCALRT
jgi:hypothetical protein